MATSLENIDDRVVKILNTESDETVYGDTLRKQVANEVQQDIFLEDVIYPFAKSKSFISTGVKTTLQAAITTSSTSLTIGNATGWPTSGALIIDGDIINFTGLTSTTVTGLTNVDASHASGRTVHVLYDLPDDYGAQIRMEVDGLPSNFVDEMELIGRPDVTAIINHGNRFHSQNRFRDEMLPVFRWSIVTDKDGTQFIFIENQTSSVNAKLHYRKIPATMTDSVNATIPDTWALPVIATETAARLFIVFGDNEDGRGKDLQAAADKAKLRMKKAFSIRDGGWRKKFGIAHTAKTKLNF